MNPCKLHTLSENQNGYGRLDRKTWGYNYIHRYVYAQYHGIELTSEDHVLHSCDNPRCIEITHLYLGNHVLNMADMVQKGRSARGSRNPKAKFTEEIVEEVKSLILQGLSDTDLALEYNMSRAAIWKIRHGLSWQH